MRSTGRQRRWDVNYDVLTQAPDFEIDYMWCFDASTPSSSIQPVWSLLAGIATLTCLPATLIFAYFLLLVFEDLHLRSKSANVRCLDAAL